jgi:hypothetical protein
MQAFRSLLGINTATNAESASKAATSARSAELVANARSAGGGEKTHAQQLATLERAQYVQLGQLQDEFQEVDAEFRQIDIARNRGYAAQKLQEKKRIQSEIEALSQKWQNTKAQQKALQTANMNLVQVIAMKDGAVELAATAQAMETIDVHKVVEDIQEANSELQQYEKAITGPIFTKGGSTIVENYEANAELDAMLAEQADKNALLQKMPDAPTKVVPLPLPPTGGTTATQSPVEVSAKEEEKQE